MATETASAGTASMAVSTVARAVVRKRRAGRTESMGSTGLLAGRPMGVGLRGRVAPVGAGRGHANPGGWRCSRPQFGLQRCSARELVGGGLGGRGRLLRADAEHR